ncbi:MAG: hypothetical protein GY803_06935 [Chloroflexi bacterium]|nr:hypothetical protein [Chloroflexota bacterium]
MSASFSRSMRMMQSGTSGRSIWALLVVVLFLAVWLAWLVGARVPVYATAENAELTGESQIVAYFAPDALLKVEPGQPALLRLDAFPWEEYGAVAATVTEVVETLQDGRIQVRLQLNPAADSRIPLQPGLTGSIEIEVEQVAPATMLLQTSGAID